MIDDVSQGQMQLFIRLWYNDFRADDKFVFGCVFFGIAGVRDKPIRPKFFDSCPLCAIKTKNGISLL